MATLAEDYLEGRDGSVNLYRHNLELGQRIGQAFFNALSPGDQKRLRATDFDPFYDNSSGVVYTAIEYLLGTE
jgi:hypothetical protein